jgi:hypothetical protein
MQERVTLPAALWEAIVTHAREGKPEEICGIVRGRGSTALEVIRGQNIAPERIENYDVDPQTLLKQFDFEEAGDEMMGIYHSIPCRSLIRRPPMRGMPIIPRAAISSVRWNLTRRRWCAAFI